MLYRLLAFAAKALRPVKPPLGVSPTLHSVERICSPITIGCLLVIVTASSAYSHTCNVVISSVPIEINRSGKWCLGQNIDASMHDRDAILIKADNVILDGNGFGLSGPVKPDAVSRGIIAYDRSGVTVRNMKLSGFNTAILFADTSPLTAGTGYFSSPRNSRDLTISNVTITDATFQAIHVRASGFTISDAKIINVGPSTLVPHAFATGIYGQGNQCRISHNLVRLGQPSGSGENVGIALYYGSGCTVSDNHVLFDRWPAWGRNFGIWARGDAGSLPVVERNTVNGASYAIGPYGAYKDNLALNTGCGLFVVRQNEAERRIDLGGNQNVMRDEKRDPMLGDGSCPDKPNVSESRYFSAPGQLSAYAAALSSGERDGESNKARTLAWFIIAANHGHVLAREIVAAPQNHKFRPGDIVEARELAKSIVANKLRHTDP